MAMPIRTQKRRCHRVRFTFQVPQNSTNGETLLWLLYDEENNSLTKEKALDAVRAFWLPLARKAASNYSERELQDTARMAIWRLKEQIYYLVCAFGLERTEAETVLSELVTTLREGKPTTQALQQSPPNLVSEVPESLNINNFDWSLDEAALIGAAVV